MSPINLRTPLVAGGWLDPPWVPLLASAPASELEPGPKTARPVRKTPSVIRHLLRLVELFATCAFRISLPESTTSPRPPSVSSSYWGQSIDLATFLTNHEVGERVKKVYLRMQLINSRDLSDLRLFFTLHILRAEHCGHFWKKAISIYLNRQDDLCFLQAPLLKGLIPLGRVL